MQFLKIVMFTVAIVASDPSDKASAAEFASSSLNAAVVFRDSVAAALEHSPLFDCIIACEDSFRDALKDRSLFIRLSGTTVLCLLDKLFFKIDLSQKGSSRSEARASALQTFPKKAPLAPRREQALCSPPSWRNAASAAALSAAATSETPS